jgi:hypothetical protein
MPKTESAMPDEGDRTVMAMNAPKDLAISVSAEPSKMAMAALPE